MQTPMAYLQMPASLRDLAQMQKEKGILDAEASVRRTNTETMKRGEKGHPLVVDSLRYTLVLPTAKYTAGVTAVRGAMYEKGANGAVVCAHDRRLLCGHSSASLSPPSPVWANPASYHPCSPQILQTMT